MCIQLSLYRLHQCDATIKREEEEEEEEEEDEEEEEEEEEELCSTRIRKQHTAVSAPHSITSSSHC